MSERKNNVSIRRREFVLAVSSGITALLAGCVGSGAQFEQVTESTHLKVTDVYIASGPLTDEVGMTAQVSGLDGIDALVWIGADGEQIGATEVYYGGGQFDIATDTSRQNVLGKNKLVAVRGGETDCFGHICGHSGGEGVESIKFKVRT